MVQSVQTFVLPTLKEPLGQSTQLRSESQRAKRVATSEASRAKIGDARSEASRDERSESGEDWQRNERSESSEIGVS